MHRWTRLAWLALSVVVVAFCAAAGFYEFSTTPHPPVPAARQPAKSWPFWPAAAAGARNGKAASVADAGPLVFADGKGGLAELSPQEATMLRQTRTVLDEMAADDRESEEVRAGAVADLEHVHEALNDWARPDLVDWYQRLLAKAVTPRLQYELVKGAEAAAKAGQYHLGGVRAFWASADAKAKERGKDLGYSLLRARKGFELVCAKLEKSRPAPLAVRPLAIPERKSNLAAILKPIDETKAAPVAPKPVLPKSAPPKPALPRPAPLLVPSTPAVLGPA